MADWTLTRDAVRDVDRRAIEEFEMPGIVLMENAGRGAAELLCTLGLAGRVVICCGKGNNGGDGFVIARHLENRGFDVRVLLFTDPDRLSGDAETNYRIIEHAGTPTRCFTGEIVAAKLQAELQNADWIVDALLGTGMTGNVRKPFDRMIGTINACNAKVLAVDVPSGMDCDTGEPLGVCVRADHTATFVARKRGFDNAASREWTGAVHVIDIGVPRKLLEAFGAPPVSPGPSV